jgi:hypothetical protein
MNDTTDNTTSGTAGAQTAGRPNPARRRTAMIGVAAGLLAGGTIGLVATAPSLTSAATDSGDEVVALQESTDESTDTSTELRPGSGARLRELLQPLVDDGTIDAAQADAVAQHLVENRPEREWRGGGRGLDGHGPNNRVVAEVLGIDAETLRTELMAGNSIADIAEANNIDVQTVIDALVADAESHIELAVEHGLDEADAAERLARITERIEEGVYRTPGERLDADVDAAG